MKGFEPVTLGWGDTEYVVPADQLMLLIAVVEDAILGDRGGSAALLLLTGEVKMNRLARAYAGALRHAGADVSDEEVYLAMQEDLADESADREIEIRNAIMGLLAIVSPPLAMKMRRSIDTPDPDEEAPGKA